MKYTKNNKLTIESMQQLITDKCIMNDSFLRNIKGGIIIVDDIIIA